MAAAAALKSIDSLSGVDAKMAALERLEKLFDQAAAEKERHKSNIAVEARGAHLAQGRDRPAPPNGR